MKAIKALFTLLPIVTAVTVSAQTPNLINSDDRTLGIGTYYPNLYQPVGDIMGLEIFNKKTAIHSQASIALSSGATVNASSIGTISWVTPNSTNNKVVAYIGSQTTSDVSTNASGLLAFATANGGSPVGRMIITANGNVGVGAAFPRALFDVTSAQPNITSAVLGRLPEGDNLGTYLGVQTFNTDAVGVKSFSLEHRFFNQLNSAISFYRGGDMTGGFMTFSTNQGIEQMRIDAAGNVGIGTTSTAGEYRLSVKGAIRAQKIKVTQSDWADFVFDPSYKLPSLQEIEQYINTNKHLPDVPSAEEVKKDGIDLGEMNKILLQKVEELTLHLIEQQKELRAMKAELDVLKEAQQK